MFNTVSQEALTLLDRVRRPRSTFAELGPVGCSRRPGRRNLPRAFLLSRLMRLCARAMIACNVTNAKNLAFGSSRIGGHGGQTIADDENG